MNDLLRASRHHKRLNNLRRVRNVLVSIPLVVLCMLLVDWGTSLSHASSLNSDSILIAPIVYRSDYSDLNYGPTPKVINIATSEGSSSHMVYSSSVEGALKELGIVLNIEDKVLPEDTRSVVNGTTLQIVKVDVETIVKRETVQFPTIEVETSDLAYGETKVVQEGVLGVMEKTVKVVYEDGKAVKSEVVERNIIETPVEKIVQIGQTVAGIQDCNLWDSVIDEYAPSSKDAVKNKWMKYIMRAETWCNSGSIAQNKYFGLFQFLSSTFIRNGGQAKDIFDGREQIRIVSKMYDNCQQWQWGPHRTTNKARTIISFKEKHPSYYKLIEMQCGRL